MTIVKLKPRDETSIVRVRVPNWLKLSLDNAARQNRRTPALEAQIRLAQTFRDDALKAHLREVNTLLSVHLDGIKDGLLAHSHTVTRLSQESQITRQRLDEAMRLIASALSESEEITALVSQRHR